MLTKHARFWKARRSASSRFRLGAFHGWCVLLLSVLFTTSAAAASRTARVVLVTSDNVELARKVRAEAEHVGILVASERAVPAGGDGELTLRHDAAGVVELTSSDRVRIHVAASGEHAAYDTVVVRAPADGDGFALRVVEQVRARFVELRLLPPEPESATTTAENQPGAAGQSATEKAALDTNPKKANDGPSGVPTTEAPTLGLTVGGGLTGASGGIGLTPGVALGLRLEPTARFTAALHALLPLVENEVNAPEGEASIRVNLFFAELGYRLAPPSAVLQPELGAGAGLVVLPMEGETTEPLEGHTDQLVAGVYFLSAGAGISLEPWLRLRGGIRAGLSAPRPVVVFDDREVAAWGRGFFAATVEAEFRLPLSSGAAGVQ